MSRETRGKSQTEAGPPLQQQRKQAQGGGGGGGEVEGKVEEKDGPKHDDSRPSSSIRGILDF